MQHPDQKKKIPQRIPKYPFDSAIPLIFSVLHDVFRKGNLSSCCFQVISAENNMSRCWFALAEWFLVSILHFYFFHFLGHFLKLRFADICDVSVWCCIFCVCVLFGWVVGWLLLFWPCLSLLAYAYGRKLCLWLVNKQVSLQSQRMLQTGFLRINIVFFFWTHAALIVTIVAVRLLLWLGTSVRIQCHPNLIRPETRILRINTVGKAHSNDGWKTWWFLGWPFFFSLWIFS